MTEPRPLAPLLVVLRDLVSWLEDTQVRGIVIGGVAASLLGRPRMTGDVDALVLLDQQRWAGFTAAGAAFGFKPRLPDPLAFARRARVLLLRHEPSGVDVDVSLGLLPFEEESVARARPVNVGGVRVPLPTPEDLIIMKAVAHRPRDIADIEAMLSLHRGLELARVRDWVRQFAEALERPEILEDLEELLEESD